MTAIRVDALNLRVPGDSANGVTDGGMPFRRSRPMHAEQLRQLIDPAHSLG